MRLIDAHKLEKEFKRIYNCDPANYQSLDWGTIKNTIRDQPKVDPVKHGYWVWIRNYTWHCSECGGLIATPGYRHLSKFPEEVRDFIQKNYKGQSNTELHRLICDRFGPVMTLSQVKTYKKNHHFDSGLTGCFKKGHIPMNKGKTWDDFMPKESQERSRKTCFTKGYVPHNRLPVGTVVKTTDGYMSRKIGEPNQWEYVHRATWESHYGPIPDGMCVTFKDGNTENCDISNLMLITRAEHARLNQNHLRYTEPELTETGLLIAKVLTAAGKRKHKDERGKNGDRCSRQKKVLANQNDEIKELPSVTLARKKRQ